MRWLVDRIKREVDWNIYRVRRELWYFKHRHHGLWRFNIEQDQLECLECGSIFRTYFAD